MALRSRSIDLGTSWSPAGLAHAGRGPRGECLWFDGSGWTLPGLVALGAHRLETDLAGIDRELAARCDPSSDGSTGLAVLLDYEALSGTAGGPFPSIVVFSVDRSIVSEGGSRWRLTARGAAGDEAEAVLDGLVSGLARAPERCDLSRAGRLTSAATTSLPRETYMTAVRQLQGWIGEGQIYQANLCQRFDATWDGDPLAYHETLARTRPAPRSAFLALGDASLASLSPETFVRLERGAIETRPIKGTRPRHADPAEDRRAAAELLVSEKDRAELLMIVDLERNDLGRICRPGSVTVPELAALRSYPAVHHLVARVRGEIVEGVRWSQLVRAVYPGGSITGAPKESAMDKIRRVEPVPRGPFTGSLFWCGDDGRVDSSILIRTAVFGSGRVSVGAGAGIVADSDPASEWAESNHKARLLTEALGFQPEDA